MTMTLGLRKIGFTAHVTCSVGWLGGVACFVALAVAGFTSENAQTVTASYLALELIGWFVLVPLSLASFLTGLVQALTTTWGLFRHYWILLKLIITVLCTILLLVHMQIASHLADVVAATALSNGDFRELRIQLMTDAVAAVVALLAATILAVYKPRGMTRYGHRKEREMYSGQGSAGVASTKTPGWVKLSLMTIVLVLVLLKVFIVPHVTGHGLGGGHTPASSVIEGSK